MEGEGSNTKTLIGNDFNGKRGREKQMRKQMKQKKESLRIKR